MIPDVSRDQLLAALDLFDEELREKVEWNGWDQKLSQKYALEYEGKLYPPKEVIRLATEYEAFSGGDEANGYLKKRGFEIKRLQALDPIADGERTNAEVPKVWWVNSAQLRWRDGNEGYLWAPKVNVRGAPLDYWQRLTKLWPGDLLLVYPGLALKSVFEVVDFYEEHTGDPARKNKAEVPGWRVRVRDYPLAERIPLGSIPKELRTPESGAFDKDGEVKKGYVFELSALFVHKLVETFVSAFTDTPLNGTRDWPIGMTVTNYWWVNQGSMYAQERSGGYIWAPRKTKAGKAPFTHWLNMTKVKPGDWIFHYSRGFLRAVGRVLEEAKEKDNPIQLGAGIWTAGGWKVEIMYFDLKPLISIHDIPRHHRAYHPGGPFNSNEGVNQGYLFPVDYDFAKALITLFSARMPKELVLTIGKLDPIVIVSPAGPRIVKIAPGDKGRFWEDCLEGGYICVGWDAVGDLRRFDSKDEFNNGFEEAYSEEYKSHTSQITIKAKELWTLMELEPGDMVVANEGTSKVLGVGTVTEAGYDWRPDRAEYKHVVYVDWDTSYAKQIPEQGRWAFVTVADVSDELAKIILEETPAVGNFWLFQANPKFYNLSEQLQSMKVGSIDNWTVTSSWGEMEPGEPVVLWQAGKQAGIYAVGELIGKPYLHTYSAEEAPWLGLAPGESKQVRRIDFRYTQILEEPILKKDLLEDQVLKNMTVITFANATNFKLKKAEWEALRRLLGKEQLVPLPPLPPSDEDYKEPSFDVIVKKVEEQGLKISIRALRRYHLGLKTRGFVILSGVSGTGKTWLTAAYAKAIGAESLLVPVAPNWNTNEDLLGYLSPLDGKYYDTAFSSFLRRASEEYRHASEAGKVPRPYHLVLDEMNLARVEYYFAKFLSVMEVRARGEEATLTLALGDDVTLPPNFMFIGTVNVDETTHGFADKVYDRAQLIELEAPRDALAKFVEGKAYAEVLMNVWDAVHEVAPFAYRVLFEIGAYVKASEELGVGWQEALDEQLLQKVLPKLKGVDPRIGQALQRVLEIAGDEFTLTADKAHVMREGFMQHGFASYF